MAVITKEGTENKVRMIESINPATLEVNAEIDGNGVDPPGGSSGEKELVGSS